MLKTGGASSEKRMYKFAKRRVSSSLSLFTTVTTIITIITITTTIITITITIITIITIIVGYPQKSTKEKRSN